MCCVWIGGKGECFKLGFGSDFNIRPFQNEEKKANIDNVTSAALLMRILDPCYDVADIMDFVKVLFSVQNYMFCMAHS